VLFCYPWRINYDAMPKRMGRQSVNSGKNQFGC
jgi:hypothetical protein